MSKYDGRRNPSKKAVALQYDVGDGAPVIVASGMGYMAEKIVEVASDSGVPIYEDNSLATILTQLKLGQEVPEELYKAIVEIYVYFLNFDPADPDKARRERQAMKEAAIAAAQAEEAEARAAAAAVEAAEKGES